MRIAGFVIGLSALAAAQVALAAGEVGEPVDVEFKAKVDGSVQRYVEILPKEFDSEKEHDLLIGLHGHGSDRWQYIKAERGECKGARDTAARHGMIFVSPDYRASTSWMGPQAEADTVQLIALLRKKYKVRRVYLTGGSMGGASALIFAALHPKLLDGVVSENGTANMIEYDNFQDAIAASYGGTKKEKPTEYKKRSPELFPKRFTMPVAFTVGGKDSAVPPDSVRRLHEKLVKAGKKDVLMIDRKNGGHGTNYEDTVTALEFVIKAATKAAEKKDGKNGSKKKPSRPD